MKVELVEYLKDVNTLESQILVYKEIEKEYKKTLSELTEESNKIYLFDASERNRSNMKGSFYVMPIPEYKPSYLGERRNQFGRKEPVFGFRGTFDMFNRLPKRWWDEELLNLEKEERRKYRIFHAIAMILSIVVGGGVSIAFENILPLFVFLLIGVGVCIYVGNENKKEYLPGDPYFEKFMAIYEKKYNEELMEKKKEMAPKIEHVKSEYERNLIRELKKTEDMLEKLYSKDLIHSKYQNIQAITQIYQYLETERCKDLEEAYFLYEEELSQEKVIEDLDLSPNQMEKFADSMGLMITILKYKNKLIDEMSDLLHKIQKNSILLEYIKENKSQNKTLIEKYNI